MSSHFKLLAAVLVLVDRTKDRDDLLFGRERDRTGNCRVIALCGLNDLLSRLIDQGAVVAFRRILIFSLTAIVFASLL